MEKLFQVPSFIQKISTLADGGNKLTVVTQELAPEEAANLFNLRRSSIRVYNPLRR